MKTKPCPGQKSPSPAHLLNGRALVEGRWSQLPLAGSAQVAEAKSPLGSPEREGRRRKLGESQSEIGQLIQVIETLALRWMFRKFDFHGPKSRAPATGQEDPVPRLAVRAVVTAAEEESTPGSSTTTEGTETTEVVATTGTGEAATDSVMTMETSW